MYLYSIKYICIQSKILVFNEKYFHSILFLLCSVTTVIFSNRYFYKEYLVKVMADIVTNKQRIATRKSSLYPTKLHKVLQSTPNNKIHSKN